MQNSTNTILFFLFLSFNLLGQESPFGTGQITDQNIGQLEDVSVVVSSESGYGFEEFFPDVQEVLQDYNFDIYVPEDYDGTEAYGLVIFINSGNNGGFKGQWLPVLDDKKLIWIAGDAIGNSIFINIRMGVGMAAALRMQELFNIDTDRIYTSGNSGGARMAHNLAFIYPETFRGAMPSCGGSYIREVAQDYETQEPDGNYESIIAYPIDYLDYLLPFDQRFANMTSFNDFREGDVMNIYHNGSEEDGLKGKFLETTGGHCSTSTEHFLDAVNFVEHPFIDVIQEEFDGSPGSSFKSINTGLDFNGNLELGSTVINGAHIQSKDLFLWNDPKGAILETSIRPSASILNNNTTVNLGIWSMDDPSNYCNFVGPDFADDTPVILLTIDFIDEQPILTVKVKNPDQLNMEVLYTSPFTDWNIDEPVAIKYHLWDKELRIELGAHLSPPTSTVSGVKLLDDMRSIRIRWNEVVDNFWENTIWGNGSFLTLSAQKVDSSQPSSDILVDHVSLSTANIDLATEIPNTSSFIEASICQGDTIIFVNTSLTESGTYITTIANAQECDSVVTIKLVVHPPLDINIVEMDGVITADAGFQSYQWYLDGVILDGETGFTIIPNEEGEYYVEIMNENGCSNTSDILNYVITSVDSIISFKVNVRPNPTSGELLIETNSLDFQAELFDLQGKSIATNLGVSNDISNLVNGIYILVIQSEESRSAYKIQKRD